MSPLFNVHLTRREFFGRTATGIGTAALASLFARDGLAAPAATSSRASGRLKGLPDLPHFAPKAKRVIYLFQNGAPDARRSVRLQAEAQVNCTASRFPIGYIGGKRFSTMTGKPDGKLLLGPVEPFAQHGQSGAWVSDFLPHTAGDRRRAVLRQDRCTPTR